VIKDPRISRFRKALADATTYEQWMEAGLELDDFVANVLNGSGAVMQASETDQQADYNKPFNPLYWALDQLL